MSRPIVGIPSCTKLINDYTFDGVKRNYTAAVAHVAKCQPLLIPVGATDIEAVLGALDGLLLTGSPSNVDPGYYGDEAPYDPNALDAARDAVTLPLVRAAINRGLPLLAICRGFQELNVTLGGTLWQAVHEREGFQDHREREELPMKERWGPRHQVKLSGRMKEWFGDEITVNSLHTQGIAELAESLHAEAIAEDGLVEAVRGPDDDAFCLAVQWHPEWDAQINPVSRDLFRHFGDAVRSYNR